LLIVASPCCWLPVSTKFTTGWLYLCSANRGETDEVKIQTLFDAGQESLEVIRRQAIISNLYFQGESVIAVRKRQKDQNGKILP
jgi:hypothetical protein